MQSFTLSNDSNSDTHQKQHGILHGDNLTNYLSPLPWNKVLQQSSSKTKRGKHMEWATIKATLGNIDIEPRDYQARIIEKTVNMFLGEYRNGSEELELAARSVMLESPTGSGKTTMGLLIAKAMQMLTGASVGWVAMRENLLQQAKNEADQRNIEIEPVHFISMFAKEPPRNIDLLIVDESQHDASSSCMHIHNSVKPKWILGLTATPFRSDKVRLCFDKIVRDAGIHQLISDGYLSKFDHYTVPRWDVEMLAVCYCAEPNRWGKSIYFFHKLSECFEFHRIVKERGVRSEVVTGNSDRDSQIKAFRKGDLQILVNCAVLTEGFDDPTLKTTWVRPSCKGPTIQMAGRALRKHADFPTKQIVQCGQTPHPFVRTATANQQFLWHPDGWRSLKINPKIDLCSQNVCHAIARTDVTLPKFLLKKKQYQRPGRGLSDSVLVTS